MKTFKVATALQLIFLFGCLIVIVFMQPLYHGFQSEALETVCLILFCIGGLISVSPIGLIGIVLTFVECFSTDLKKSKKILIWTVVSPFLLASAWLVAACLFGERGAGV